MKKACVCLPLAPHTDHGLQGSRLPSSIHPARPTLRLIPDSGQDTPASTQPPPPPSPLKWTCGGLYLLRLRLLCPNFPLYTQIICDWVMQTEGSSKCMWTSLMAPVSWSWNRTFGSGMAAVKICTVAIRQRGLHRSAGVFPQLRSYCYRSHTYSWWIYIIPFCWIWNELPRLIHKLKHITILGPWEFFFSFLSFFFLQSVKISLRWIFEMEFCLALLLTLCRLTGDSSIKANIGHASYSNVKFKSFFVSNSRLKSKLITLFRQVFVHLMISSNLDPVHSHLTKNLNVSPN